MATCLSRDCCLDFKIDFDKIEPHDESVLPHLHDYDYALEMFPTIEAAEPQPNLDDWTPGDNDRFEMSDEVAYSQKSVKKRGVLRVAPGDLATGSVPRHCPEREGRSPSGVEAPSEF
mgnify:FL=1